MKVPWNKGLPARNKGVRHQHVRERTRLFQAGLPIKCPYHGEHLEWAEYKSQSQTYSVVRCKRCMKAQSKSWHEQNYLQTLAMHARTRDKSSEIDKEFLESLLLKQNGVCALTGVVFDERNRPSVDRIDSTQGYLKGNVQLVLFDINRMKTDLPLEIFLQRCKQVSEHCKP